jgi:dTDP-4-dehydrorhamnose reductase
MRILLTGRNGQLGGALAAALQVSAEVVATARAQLDLEDGRAVRETVQRLRPDLIINAAAFTQVDLAEKERDAAYRVNAAVPGILGREAQLIGAAVVHYSTDYVFDGTKRGGYREDDATRPLNMYGRTKLAGEQAVRESGAAHAILRISWLYGGAHGNFLSTMCRLLGEQDEVSVVDDQAGCPTWTGAVADATRALIDRIHESGERPAAYFHARGGTFHLSSPDSTSWFGFAAAIAEHMASQGRRTARVLPISTEEYPRPAARPEHSVLVSNRIRDRFGIALQPWRDQLSECFENWSGMASAA